MFLLSSIKNLFQTASGRAPGSILEAPGSIFEAPKLDLEGFWNDFFDIFGQNTKKAKKRLKPAKQELNHKWPDCQGWVGGGAPPRGGFNPPPAEGGAGRARPPAPSLSNTS